MFSARGEIDRGTYALWGLVLAAFKLNLDRVVAAFFFKRAWYFWSYWNPGSATHDVVGDRAFFFTLAAISVPFVWVGTCLTLRRLNAAKLPRSLVLLFFVPAVNIALFLVLCAFPKRTVTSPSQMPSEIGSLRWMPEGKFGAAAVSVAIVTSVSTAFIYFSVHTLRNYGWGIFIGIPFFLGFTSVLLYAARTPRDLSSCLAVALLSLGLLGTALLALAIEGVVCILMAVPIALPIAILGALAGYGLQNSFPWHHKGGPVLFGLAAIVPLWLDSENSAQFPVARFSVTTTVAVQAPPERVWSHVIAFSEIPPPRELIFKTGIAYPVKAEISGSGAGAVRRCLFSTGAFVEPITHWEAPTWLAFNVAERPPPLTELSPYGDLKTAHVGDYFRSTHGEFRLAPGSDGSTILQGTTWYEHRIWPAAYWRLWSDYLVHKIHRRVLDHIKREAEGEAAAYRSSTSPTVLSARK